MFFDLRGNELQKVWVRHWPRSRGGLQWRRQCYGSWGPRQAAGTGETIRHRQMEEADASCCASAGRHGLKQRNELTVCWCLMCLKMLKVLISAPDESNWTDYGRLQTNAKIPKQQLFRRRLMFTRVSQPHGDGATIWWQAAHAIGAPPHHGGGDTQWRRWTAGAFTKRYPEILKNISLDPTAAMQTGTQIRFWRRQN